MTSASPNTQLDRIDAYWQASNYLCAGMLYLRDNALLRRPLHADHIKRRILGHWGTCPGQSFTLTHLNRLIVEHDLNLMYVCGPGHGIDRYSLARDVLKRVPRLRTCSAAHMQSLLALQAQALAQARAEGIDSDDIVNWQWPAAGTLHH